jgi:hypothetical protein
MNDEVEQTKTNKSKNGREYFRKDNKREAVTGHNKRKR